jgi:transmembrane sensor
MTQDRVWILLARKLAKVATTRELYELEKLTIENPQLHFSMKLISSLWQKRDELQNDEEAEERLWELLEKAHKDEALRTLASGRWKKK